MSLPRVILKPKRAQPFFARHPWVFAGAIDRVEGDPADGAEVEVVSSALNFVARGLFNSQSKIRVRLYCWEPDRALDRDFFRDRLSRALRFRESIGLRGANQGCRLVFSEADGLSGLTLDEYAGWVVAQFTALGLANRRDLIADVLEELIQPKGIYIRTEKGVNALEGLDLRDSLFRGAEPPLDLAIEEHGLRIVAHLQEGQKTGYFLDQRDNRAVVAKWAAGRTVLDAFSYTGGFGLHAARAGAMAVECVDVSAAALEIAGRNAALNNLANLSFVKADVFVHLDRLAREERRFGMVILDPPKFARSRSAIPEAMRGYRRLLTLGLRLLEPDGILVMCCCTGIIAAESIEELIAQVAIHDKREVQILARLGQAADHPVSVACLESNYLKCFICRAV